MKLPTPTEVAFTAICAVAAYAAYYLFFSVIFQGVPS